MTPSLVALRRFALLGCLLSFSVGPATWAADASTWPSWRGTSGAGLAAPTARPPLKWSETENVRWKAKIPGLGFSTPIVWQDRIFLATAIETKERGQPMDFIVMAVDRKTGKTVWQKTARNVAPHEGRHATNSFASGSPVTDGKRLWVTFGSRGLYCYDLDGNLLWERDLGQMKTRMGFGEGASPAIAGDLLIMPWDNEEKSFLLGLNKLTGAEVWRAARTERTSWSTPLIVEVDGKLQAILPASNKTRSYDAATGELVWEASGLTGNVIPMPVTGHGRVYVMSGFQGYSAQAIKLTAKGDVSGTDNIVWNVRKSTPYVPSPVLSGDRLYFSKSNDAYLSCLNAHTGEFHYQDQALPNVRSIYASPVAANGYLYVVGREGTTAVVKDGAAFEIVATNVLNDRIDASPVMLDRELFLRGHEFLYCIAEG